MRCTRFMGSADLSRILMRHARQARGVGNPLVAAYLRSYIARVGLQANVKNSNYVRALITDTMYSLRCVLPAEWRARSVPHERRPS